MRPSWSMLGVLALLAASQLIVAPALLGEGLPSLSRNVFHSATIGYYIETALVTGERWWWTPCWCAGFQDTLRFYPPLGIIVLRALIHAGGIYWSAATAMAVALAVTVVGVAAFAEAMAHGRRAPAVAALALLSILSVEAWVTTISVYWEYTRLMGDGFALLSLALLHRSIRDGSDYTGVLAGVAGGAAALSSLVSLAWLAAAAPILAAGMSLEAGRRGADPYAQLYPLRVLWLYGLALTGVAGWWLVPALLPWGVTHYLRVHASLAENLARLAHSLSIDPPLYAPAIQLPILAPSVAALAVLWRRGERIPAYLAASTLALTLALGQGQRLIPILALFMVTGLARACLEARGRAARLCQAALVVMLAAYAAHYYPGYAGMLRADWSFVGSDEYRVALWLKAHADSNARIYAMYGERLHANQWLNVFHPDACQVLSGFMEGCLNRKVFLLDHYIKDTLDHSTARRLMESMNVRYVWVDKEWYDRRRPNVVEVLVATGYLAPVEQVNKELSYSLLLEVHGSPENPVAAHRGVEPVFLTPARMLGLAASLSAALALIRARRAAPRA